MKKHSVHIFAILGFVVCSLLIVSCKTTKEIKAPDDSQIKEVYKQAAEAYGWFDLTTMPVDFNDSKKYDKNEYYKVKHGAIKTYNDLVCYLKTLFADSIVQDMLNRNDPIKHYVDIDGALYALDSRRGTDITKGEETHEILREGDNKIIYRVTIEVVDEETRSVEGHEVHNFAYELIDGKWLFSNFYLVK